MNVREAKKEQDGGKQTEGERSWEGRAPGSPWSSSFLLAARKGDGENTEREKLVSRTLGEGWGKARSYLKRSVSSRGGKSATPSCDVQQKLSEKEEILRGRV